VGPNAPHALTQPPTPPPASQTYWPAPPQKVFRPMEKFGFCLKIYYIKEGEYIKLPKTIAISLLAFSQFRPLEVTRGERLTNNSF
jgi:hypothetical protein